MREGLIEAIEAGVEAAELHAKEAEIVRYVREPFQKNRMSEATFEALRARLGDQGIVDLMALLGYDAFVGRDAGTPLRSSPAVETRLHGSQ